MTEQLARTPLYSWHQSHQAKLVDFAGWEMPVHYGSIVREHEATRHAAALYDVSHMGRFRFDGAGSGNLLDRLVTRRVADLAAGQIRYGLMTNEEGGILDDVLVYRLIEPPDSEFWWMVVNAGNRAKIWEWLSEHRSASDDASVSDHTLDTAMIAVQGPRAVEITARLFAKPVQETRYYHGKVTKLFDQNAIVSRTGYTGEDGFEITVPKQIAVRVWESLLNLGASTGMLAAGLGARDTLRLEAAMPLYGHELSEQINPIQAGLSFAVNLKDRCFPGSDALRQLQESGLSSVRVGLTLDGRRPARGGCAILDGESRIGEVTSGTFSPTLDRPIAMGYINPVFAEPGTGIGVDIRGTTHDARIVKLPFYRRA